MKNTESEKALLRQQMKRTLAELTEQQVEQAGRKVCENFIGSDCYRKASVVMVYLSLPHEVDTTRLILHAWQNEKTVAVPKIFWESRHMIAVEITSLESDLTIGRYGLRSPARSVPVPVEQIDVVVAPGLAFDRDGNRLGRGSAYYDRFFDSSRLRATRCGLAFSQQMIQNVPATEHDRRVDMIVTEQELIYCNNSN